MKAPRFSFRITVCLFLITGFTAFSQSYQELKTKGEKAYQEGNFPAALQAFEAAVKAYPENPEANINYGYVAVFLVNPDVGLKHLNKAISDAPDSVNWLISRAQVLTYLEDFEGSNKDLQVYEARSDKPELAYTQLAKNYRKLDLAKAMDYVEKAENTDLELSADFYYTKGDILMAQREYMLAIQSLSQAINLQPQWADPYFLRGLSFFQAFKYSNAIKDYDSYLQILPEDDFILALRGNAKLETGDFEGALADFNKSIQLYDQGDIAFIGRSDYYRVKEQYDKALADLNKAAQINPKNVKIFGKQGLVYAKMNNFSQSVESYSKAIQLEPRNGEYYASRSLSYLKLEQNEKALTDANKSIELIPGYSDGYLNGSLALFNMNKFPEALKFINSGIEANPEDGMMYYTRSAIHKEMGNTSAAEADDAKAKQLLTK